jgi:outer membrane protein assembly factor BamB
MHTRRRAFLTKQRLPLLLFLLTMLIISSCGINPASSAGQTSSHNIATDIGNSPEPGNIRKPYIPANGHYESLLTAHGITYFGSDNGNVYALQSSSGKVLWHYNTGNLIYVFAMMNSNIYAVGGANQDMVYALNAQTGALQWKFQVDSPVFGNVASNGSIYINTNGQSGHGGYVYAINAANGRLRWHYTGPIDMPTPLILAEGIVYITTSNMHPAASTYLMALRASDGQVLWRFKLGEPAGTPVMANGTVYINLSSGAIDALQANSGHILWSYSGSANDIYQLTIAGNFLYANDGKGAVFSLQLNNGKLIWQRTISVAFGDSLYGPAVVNNGNISLYTHEGIVYSLNTGNGTLLWQHSTNHSTISGNEWQPLPGKTGQRLLCSARQRWLATLATFRNDEFL